MLRRLIGYSPLLSTGGADRSCKCYIFEVGEDINFCHPARHCNGETSNSDVTLMGKYYLLPLRSISASAPIPCLTSLLNQKSPEIQKLLHIRRVSRDSAVGHSLRALCASSAAGRRSCCSQPSDFRLASNPYIASSDVCLATKDIHSRLDQHIQCPEVDGDHVCLHDHLKTVHQETVRRFG